MKACIKCKEVKPISEFYKHKQMPDGHLNKCKECAKADVRANRLANIDYYKEYDKKRANRPDRVFARKAYQRTDRGRMASNMAKRRFIENNPLVRSAHIAVGNAIRAGKLLKPGCCSVCKSENLVQAHHDDYTKPLDVRWLCDSCHKEWHKHNDPIVEAA